MPEQSPLMRATEIMAFCTMSRSHFFNLIQKGEFPEPCIKRPRFTRWRRTDVLAWLAKEMGEAEAAWTV